MHYFNEFDSGAAAWLRELMAEGLIPKGIVDERSIKEVQASDLEGYVQCHFFAGIGGWPLALRLAGWSDDRPCWTGSCPCQPYSAAGKGLGDADPRNLWPDFYRLIRECRPQCVFGEQVESAIRHGWLDGVSADLEGEGYAVGSCVLGAHSVGAPHIRQRLFWVADAELQRTRSGDGQERPSEVWRDRPSIDGTACDGMEHPSRDRREQGWAGADGWSVASGCSDGGLGDSNDTGSQGRNGEELRERADEQTPGPRSAWADSRIIVCRDGKARRIPRQAESVLLGVADGLPGGVDDVRLASLGFPLAGKVPNRVSLLRGFGNAIVPEVAAEFIRAFFEARGESRLTSERIL